MLKRINRSLRLKLVLATIVVEVIMLALLLGNSVRLINQSIEAQTNARIKETHPLFEATLSERLFEGDYVSIRDILRQLMNSGQGFTYVLVLDRDGKQFANVGDIRAEALPEPDPNTTSALTDGVFDVAAPLMLGGQLVGEVRYGLSLTTLLHSRDSVLTQGALIAAMEVMLSILILLILGYWLTRHLNTLVRGTQMIRDGDYSLKLDESPQDETGKLARNFNAMSVAVRRRTEELKRAQMKFQGLVEGMNDGIFIAQQGVLKYVNPSGAEMTGYTMSELTGMPFIQLIAPDYREAVLRNYRERLTGTLDLPNTYRFQAMKQDGEFVWVEINAILSAWYDEPATLNVIRDVTDQVEVEEALFQQKERAEVTLTSIADGVITTNNTGNIEFMNPVAERLTGWTLNAARGKPLGAVLRLSAKQDGRALILETTSTTEGHIELDLPDHVILSGRDKKKTAVQVSAAAIRDARTTIAGTVIAIRDVTHEQELREQLSHQATHDPLTGLVNRREFERRLEQAFSNTTVDNSVDTMLYLDLDQFKVVNDTCGHLAGDALLKQLGSELLSKIRKTDTLARLGGDEFGVLLRGCSAEQARNTAKVLIDAVKSFHFTWGNATFALGVSIGLAEITAQSKSAQEVMSSADVACYAAKDKGRNRIHVYETSDTELATRHRQMHWASDLTLALRENRFVLYQQPIVAVSGTTATSAHLEVLLRMLGQDDEIVLPEQFIPAAERFDLMSAIDRYVIQKTFAFFAEHLRKRNAPMPRMLSLNLSGGSINGETFFQFVKDEFKKHNVPPESFCFQITETEAIANLAHARRLFNGLKELGCRLSLDKFGSGLSSFGYLKSLPVDYLKMDSTFVRGITAHPTDYAMVEAINSIGHTLGLQTVAEGVEDKQTLSCLEKIGVDYVQGYLFATPQPLEDLTAAPRLPVHEAS